MVALYPGRDAHGGDAKMFEPNPNGKLSKSGKLRSSAHYNTPNDTKFDKYCLKKWGRDEPLGWLYFSIAEKNHCYEAIEAYIIETFEFLCRPSLMNDSILVVANYIDSNIDNRFRFEILAYFLQCTVHGNFVDDIKYQPWLSRSLLFLMQ